MFGVYIVKLRFPCVYSMEIVNLFLSSYSKFININFDSKESVIFYPPMVPVLCEFVSYMTYVP